MKVLVLGADGFIGRHIAFGLRASGAEVIASARRVSALKQMGFTTLQADLSDPATHKPGFWRPTLKGAVHVINCAGLLTGSEQAFHAVHVDAPATVLAAIDGGHMVHISAVGIDSAETPFARWRRAAEAALSDIHKVTILRPGLVVGDRSYGGSSLMRAMAALPFARPLIGRGQQPFNPIHAEDLAQVIHTCLTGNPGHGPFEIGGPETVTQDELSASYRRWMGLRPAPALRLPLTLARGLGQIGDLLKLGPVSATSVAQLEAGVEANPARLLSLIPSRPRAIGTFLAARPAGTQDLWHARTYLLKPLIRLLLAVLWIGSALVGVLTPDAEVIKLVPTLPDGVALLLARGGGIVDLLIGLALVVNWKPKPIALTQLVIVTAYTLGLSIFAPCLWADPLGGVLKNLPVLGLMLVHLALLDER